MYVRWKKRARTQRHRPTGEQTLFAILVKSVRVEGKTRQQIISYLGSIGSNRLGMYYHQFDFWQTVQWKLSTLDLTPEVRDTIEKSIKAVVPKPTQEGLTQELRSVAEKINNIKGKV